MQELVRVRLYAMNGHQCKPLCVCVCTCACVYRWRALSASWRFVPSTFTVLQRYTLFIKIIYLIQHSHFFTQFYVIIVFTLLDSRCQLKEKQLIGEVCASYLYACVADCVGDRQADSVFRCVAH